MAAPTMGPIAIIRKHLEEAEPDLLRELLRDVVETLMSAEVDGLAGAAYGSRSAERTNRRNGYRGRRWDTRVRHHRPQDSEAPRGVARWFSYTTRLDVAWVAVAGGLADSSCFSYMERICAPEYLKLGFSAGGGQRS